MSRRNGVIKFIGLLGLGATCVISFSSCSKKEDTDGAHILHIGNSGEPLSLDPHQASGAWERRILTDLFVGLTTSDKDGKPIPGLAREWSVSEDGLVWTFKLRDAKWSDGVAVSADDFVFSLRRLFTMKPPAQYASLLFLIKNSQAVFEGKLAPDQLGVRAIDNKTLEITLNNPAPYLPGLLSHFTAVALPKHVIEKIGDDFLKPGNMVTNGPFILTEWAPNDYIRVIKNKNFYDEANVCLNEMFYYPTQDDAAAERGIKTGKYDVQTSFSGTRLEELNHTLPGFARVAPFVATTFYVFNVSKKPFDDVRVRGALSMAINREFITDKILKGGQTPAYSIVPPGINNYHSGQSTPEWKNSDRAIRLANARKLLESAGFGPNHPLKFSFRYRNSGDNPRIAPVVQQNWREIAPWVEVEIIGSDVQIHYDKLRIGDFEVGDSAWVADFDDARNFLYNFETSAGIMNNGKYSNAQYDEILKQSDNEVDANKREQLILKAEKIAVDENAIAPVYFYTSRNLVNPRVTGWSDNATDTHPGRYLCTTQANGK